MRLPTMLLSIVAGWIALILCIGIRSARAAEDEPASAHFDAGVRAFEEQRLADAALEFEQSFALRPAYQVLFNLGSVYAALGRPVDAVDALERYLRQAGPDAPAERRAEVERELDRQRAKLGRVEISITVPGVELQLDARMVGTSPLQRTLTLAAGTHVFQTSGGDFRALRSELTIVAGQTTRYAPALAPIQPLPRAKLDLAPPAHAPGFTQRVVGYTLGGVGLATLAAGIVVIVNGQARHFEAVEKAKADMRPKAEALEADANREKIAGYSVTAIGGAVFVAGAVLLLSAPRVNSTRNAALHMVPWASASAAGFTWRGRWQ